jgi:hypothetical protein
MAEGSQNNFQGVVDSRDPNMGQSWTQPLSMPTVKNQNNENIDYINMPNINTATNLR